MIPKKLLIIRFVGVALFTCFMVFHLSSVGQTAQAKWPDKPVRIIIPAGPGASIDRLSRLLQQFYSDELGVPVVIQNRPGGMNVVGIQHVWAQPADGHTILVYAQPYFAGMVKRLDHVFSKGMGDVSFLGGLNVDYAGPVVNPKLGKYKTLKEIFEALRRGQKVTAASLLGDPGLVGLYAVCDELKIPMFKVVLYSGGGELRVDTLGGHVDVTAGTHDGFLPLHKAGRVKFIAFFSAERLKDFPEVPTVREVVEEFGGKADNVPELLSFRFFAVNRKVKTNFPDRYEKLVSGLRQVGKNKGFLKVAKRSGFSIRWVEPEKCFEWSDRAQLLVERYPEAFPKK